MELGVRRRCFNRIRKKKFTPKGQPRNRLSFFYADRQKGATSYDETERENPRELTAEIEGSKKKIQQYENREKVLRQKLSQEDRLTPPPYRPGRGI